MDDWLQRTLSMSPGFVADLAQVITFLGDPVVVLLLVVVVTWRQWMRMSVALVGSLVVRLVYAALKSAIGRERPDVTQQIVHASGYAMPSGHAAGIAFVAALVFLLLPRFRWHAIAIAALVGWSRVALGVHFPSDVLVGWAIGAALGYACALLARRVETGTIRAA